MYIGNLSTFGTVEIFMKNLMNKHIIINNYIQYNKNCRTNLKITNNNGHKQNEQIIYYVI